MTESNVALSTPTASLWEDFVDIFFSPASVFRRRERGSWIVPLLIVTIATAVIALASRNVLQPVMDAEIERATDVMRKNPQITEDAIARARGILEFSTTWGPVMFMPILIVIDGLMTWLVAKLVDSRQTLNAAMVVAAYAFVPRVLQGVVNAIQGLVMRPDQLDSLVRLSFSPARFLDPTTANPVLLQVLTRFDLFTIWVTVLLAVGVYATGRVSKERAAVAGMLFWVVGTIPNILTGLRAAAAAG